MVTAVDEMYAAKEKFKPESNYKAFFANMQAHRSDWRHFFSVENNQYLWAEKVVPLLGNLSMIYRQRHAYAQCDEVMAVYKEVLECFQEMIARRRAARLSDDNELVNCRVLVYRYHRVVVNLAADTLRFSDSLLASYRVLFQFEMDTQFVATEEDDGFLWIFTEMMGRPATSAALQATTDKELRAVVQVLFQSFRALAASPAYQKVNTYPKVELAVCAGCSTTEPSLNTFKLCARCKAVKYCCKVRVQLSSVYFSYFLLQEFVLGFNFCDPFLKYHFLASISPVPNRTAKWRTTSSIRRPARPLPSLKGLKFGNLSTDVFLLLKRDYQDLRW